MDWSHHGLGFSLLWMRTARSWGPRDHGSRKPLLIVVQWELRPPRPPLSLLLCWPLFIPPPYKSSHIPPGNRKPQLQPRLQTAPPSGQGVWEERPEARGQGSALFLPEVMGDPGGDRGQGRTLVCVSVCVCEVGGENSRASIRVCGVLSAPWFPFDL